MARKAKEPAKPKQGHLPDMEPPSVPEIDKAAEAYRDARNERMAITEEETKKHGILLQAMQKHGFTTYEYDGFIVSRSATEKCKVRKKKEPGESDDE